MKYIYLKDMYKWEKDNMNMILNLGIENFKF